MSDLDAVRKAYDDVYGAFAARTFNPKAAHDAGLAAVVEWAMNRAAEVAIKSGGEYIDLWQPNLRMPPEEEVIASDIREAASALLSDLTEKPVWNKWEQRYE
jgi:hypothetical protein